VELRLWTRSLGMSNNDRVLDELGYYLLAGAGGEGPATLMDEARRGEEVPPVRRLQPRSRRPWACVSSLLMMTSSALRSAAVRASRMWRSRARASGTIFW